MLNITDKYWDMKNASIIAFAFPILLTKPLGAEEAIVKDLASLFDNNGICITALFLPIKDTFYLPMLEEVDADYYADRFIDMRWNIFLDTFFHNIFEDIQKQGIVTVLDAISVLKAQGEISDEEARYLENKYAQTVPEELEHLKEMYTSNNLDRFDRLYRRCVAHLSLETEE